MITATRVTAAAAFGAAALLLPLGLAGTASAAAPPSVVQLCAATDIEAVDALLDGVASTELVGSLAPLASLTVPQDPSGVTVRGDVQLTQVRTALSCAATDTPTPTPTTTPPPSTEAPAPLYPDCAAAVAAGAAPIVLANGEPGYRPELDRDGDGIACEVNEDPAPTTSAPTTTSAPASGGFSQLDDVPSKAAETGGGPA